MDKEQQRRVAEALLEEYGTTYAEEAGIRLKNTPSPLYQLLVASILFSARISAENAVRASKALLGELNTPDKMEASNWEQRVDLLNKNGYARYDESTSSMLRDSIDHLQERYDGDLRNLRDEAHWEVEQEFERLQEFKGIGKVGAKIFLREAQAIWTEVYPFVDDRASEAAASLGLPKTAKALSELVEGSEGMARLVAALIRVDLAGAEARDKIMERSSAKETKGY